MILPDSGIARMAMCSRDARHEFLIGDGNRSVAVINEDSGASSASGGGSIFFTRRRCYRALSGVSFQNSVSSGCCCSSSSSCGSAGKWSPGSSAPEAALIFQHAGSSEEEDFYDEEDASELTKVTKDSGTVRVTFIQRVTPEAPELSDESDVYDRNNSSGSEMVDTAALPEHIYDDVCSSDVETALPALPALKNSGAIHSDSSGTESEFSGLDLAIFEPDKADRAFIYRPPRPVRNPSGAIVRKSGDKSFLERGRTFRERLKRPLRKLFITAPQPPAIDYSGADAFPSAPLGAVQATHSAPLSVHLPLALDSNTLPAPSDEIRNPGLAGSAGTAGTAENPEADALNGHSGRVKSNQSESDRNKFNSLKNPQGIRKECLMWIQYERIRK